MTSNLQNGLAIIKNIQKNLPNSSGVYRMLDKNKKILYIGKAKNLKNRVASYTKQEGHSYRILMMIAQTVDMEIVVTESETAAFLLENDLIKSFKPPFNILLKDDKTFAHILIRQNHDFPQILKVRGAKKKIGKYFGPFTNAQYINKTITLMQKVFLLRSCTDSNFANRARPCLMYQIKRCCAPCVDLISKQDYNALVNQAIDFFDGKDTQLQQDLIEKMNTASSNLDFETATVFRDRIKALNQIQAQSENKLKTINSCDFIAMYQEGQDIAIQVFFVRNERHYGAFVFFPEFFENNILDNFIGQFYNDYPIPSEIVVYPNLETKESATIISTALHTKVTLNPKGNKATVLADALGNAKNALYRKKINDNNWNADFDRLAKLINIFNLEKIEIYDNSHIQSAFALGVAVCATRKGFSKKDYRKFNIKDLSIAGNDTAMMEEVLFRRIKKGLLNDDLPELFIIDGGKGQLRSALNVARRCDANINLLAIAKGEKRNAGGETLYMPNQEPIILEKDNPILFFVERLRDEAHRFAIGSHRKKRTKETIITELANIPGIGDKRKKILLTHFGSAKAVKQASLADLKKISGFNDNIAKKVYDYFNF